MEQTTDPAAAAGRALPIKISLTAVVTLMAIILYFIGANFHEAYFHHFRIDVDRFPRDQLKGALYGINSAFHIFAEAMDSGGPLFWRVVLALTGACATAALIVFAMNWADRKPQLRRIRDTVRRSAGPHFALVFASLAPLALFLGLVVLTFLTMLTAALVAEIGFRAGHAGAQNAIDVFEACPTNLPRGYAYAQILDGEANIIDQGFLVAAADARVALYDNGVAWDTPVDGHKIVYLSAKPRGGDPAGTGDHDESRLSASKIKCG